MKPIYLFFGEEQFLIEEEVQKLITAKHCQLAGMPLITRSIWQQKAKAGEVEALSSPCLWQRTEGSLGTPFSPLEKEDRERASAPFDNWPPQSTLILWAEKIDQRTRVYQQIKKAGKVQEFPRLSGKDLSSWLRQHARTKYHLKLSAEVEAILLRLMGNDLRLLDQELAKLATYLGPENSQPTPKRSRGHQLAGR